MSWLRPCLAMQVVGKGGSKLAAWEQEVRFPGAARTQQLWSTPSAPGLVFLLLALPPLLHSP